MYVAMLQYLSCFGMLLIFQNKHLFTGTGAQRLIGLREDVQEFKVADFRGTHWTHVFVESRGKNRKLMPGSSFLFCECIQ